MILNLPIIIIYNRLVTSDWVQFFKTRMVGSPDMCFVYSEKQELMDSARKCRIIIIIT